jgi:hypothetical protein
MHTAAESVALEIIWLALSVLIHQWPHYGPATQIQHDSSRVLFSRGAIFSFDIKKAG